jgi:hypothetical protein
MTHMQYTDEYHATGKCMQRLDLRLRSCLRTLVNMGPVAYEEKTLTGHTRRASLVKILSLKKMVLCFCNCCS